MTFDEITRSVDLPVDPKSCWNTFVHDFNAWWPREHCFCGEAALDRVFIDENAGRWGETTLDGAHRAWGGVLHAQPGQFLCLGWQMDATVSPWVPEPDPERASLIDISFDPIPTGTRITLRHHGFSRQGEPHAQAMRDVMIGLDRWHDWLGLFRDFVSKGH